MSPTKTTAPPPACTGEFRTRCVACRQPTHAATTHGPNRSCADGHEPYGGKGRCRRCYRRDHRAGRLPARSPLRRPARKRKRPVTLAKEAPAITVPAAWRPVPEHLRASTPAPCDHCGHLVRLRFGPGDALCPPCTLAQALDMRGLPVVSL